MERTKVYTEIDTTSPESRKILALALKRLVYIIKSIVPRYIIQNVLLASLALAF